MKKKVYIFMILIFALIILSQYILTVRIQTKLDTYKKLQQKEDSINSSFEKKIDTFVVIKDSVDVKIKRIIIKIKEDYEKVDSISPIYDIDSLKTSLSNTSKIRPYKDSK